MVTYFVCIKNILSTKKSVTVLHVCVYSNLFMHIIYWFFFGIFFPQFTYMDVCLKEALLFKSLICIWVISNIFEQSNFNVFWAVLFQCFVSLYMATWIVVPFSSFEPHIDQDFTKLYQKNTCIPSLCLAFLLRCLNTRFFHPKAY